MSSKWKLLAFLLVLTDNVNNAYCRPQQLSTDDVPPITSQLTNDERELMKNPYFTVLFREFLTQVSKIAQVQSENSNLTSFTSQFSFLKPIEGVQNHPETLYNETKTESQDKAEQKDINPKITNENDKNTMQKSNEVSETFETYSDSLDKKLGQVSRQNISDKTQYSNTFQQTVVQENSQVSTNQNTVLDMTQEASRQSAEQNSEEDTNTTEDDEMFQNKSGSTANYNAIRAFQEEFGKRIAPTTTESSSENYDINQTSEALTAAAAVLQQKVSTNQNNRLDITQEDFRQSSEQNSEEDTNTTEDDETFQNKSESTANYNAIRAFQEEFGKRIAPTTTENFKETSYENYDINQTSEALTAAAALLQQRVSTNQNNILDITQEDFRQLAEQNSEEDTNTTEDDEIFKDKSESTANYNAIRAFQEEFGKRIAPTTTESNSENYDINQPSEALTTVSVNFENKRQSSDEEMISSERELQFFQSDRITKSSVSSTERNLGVKSDNKSDSSSTVNSEENDASDESDEDVKEKPIEAKYQFATRVDDNLHGNFQQREETREGGTITGSYAYDDGNILRSVTYIADAKGYRIIKDETSPSIKAIQKKNGQAKVMTYYNGHTVQYDITQGSEDEEEEE